MSRAALHPYIVGCRGVGIGRGRRQRTVIEQLLDQAVVLNDLGTPTYTGATSKTHQTSNATVGAGARRRRPIALSRFLATLTDAIEPTRTNLLAPGTSEHFALWTNVAAAIIADGVATAPDGTLTASTIQDNDAASFSGARQLFTVANDGLSHCFSIDVKKTSGGTAPTFGIAMLLTGGTGVTINARINTDTGASNVSTLRVDDHGTFWRVFAKVTNNTTGNTTLTLTVYPAVAPYQAAPASASDAASATGTAVVYGADLQKAEWPTTYISNRNLLLQTYTLANAAWGKGTGYTVTDGQADRNGGTLASRVVYAGGSGGTVLAQSRAIAGGTANKSFTMSFWYKSTGGATQNFRADNVQGGVIDTYQILAATATWQQCVFTVTNGASAGTGNQGFNLQSVVADSAYDITISDIQLEYGTAASPSWANTTAVGLRAADALTISLASLIDTRRNLIVYAEQFDNAAWTKTGILSVTANVSDPNGNSYADTVIEDTGLSNHGVSQNITKAASALPYTFVCRAKPSGRNLSMTLDDAGGNGIQFTVDLATGATITSATFGTAWTLASSVATLDAAGFYRVVLSGTSNTATTLRANLRFNSGTSQFVNYTGDGVSGVTLFGAQVVAGLADPGVVGYVATAGTAQTADVTGLNISAGTVLAILMPMGWSGDQDGTTVWQAYSGTSNFILAFRTAATTLGARRSDSAGTEQASVTHGLTNRANTVLGHAWASDGVRAYINGAANGTDLSVAAPYSQVTSITIGSDTGGANQFSGEVLLLYIPRALSAAEILTFSTAVAAAA